MLKSETKMDQVQKRAVSGQLLVITGPSGVGKDTVMDWLIEHADPKLRLSRVKRTITRPLNSGGEDHESVSRAVFEKLENSGAFSVTWHAHGLCYGWPISLTNLKATGENFIVNGSRRALGSIKSVFPDAILIVLTADRKTIAERLQNRGREDSETIVKRLKFAGYDVAEEFVPHFVDNSGAVEVAGKEILRIAERSRLDENS